MKNALFISSLLLFAATTPSFASDTTHLNDPYFEDQVLGFSTGSLVGGVIAGPPGIIVGALVGSLVGQSTADEKEKEHLLSSNTELQTQITDKNKQLLLLQEESSRKSLVLHETHISIERLLKENQELKNHALNFDVQFRTNSIDIEKRYEKHLSDLANALNTTPNMEIEIAGFADRAGDEEYNLELSIQRAKNVRDYLVNHGIEEERITTLAHGETQPLYPEANLENNFFDRRVSIYLRPIEISTENVAAEIINFEKNNKFVSKL